MLLVFTMLVSKTCGSANDEISQQEAVDLAIAEASFTPCEPEICRQVRYLQQGVPPSGFWGVVLSEEIVDGRPTRTESFLVNATTGAVTQE